MHLKSLSQLGILVTALGLAGCGGGDVAGQLGTNQQLRDQVMGVIAGNADLGVLMEQKLLANDSLRTKVVDAMLQDTNASQYVLYRIATNKAAVDLILQAAVADSAMREHIISVVKGVEMAQAAKK